LLRIGAAAVRVDRRDTRCVVVNVDPATGRPDAAMLRLIGRHRVACAGVYGSTVRPGLVRIGDPVTITPGELARREMRFSEAEFHSLV
jgi:hypothetical protein